MQLHLNVVLAALVLLMPAAGPSTKATPAKVKIAGTYTNVYYNEEAGDLLGMEIKIIPPSEEEHQAVVFVCEGSIGPMRLADVRVRGTNVSFEVRESDEASWSFVGTVSAKSLKGTITHSSGGRQTVTLQRRCGYWDC
jgi:hypothetical protein